MKKYSLVTLLSLFCIPHAKAQTAPLTDEYYKKALENTQKLDVAKSQTAESIYESATQTAKKIQELNEKLEKAKTAEKTKSEELQALQVELSLLQAQLQVDTLKVQSLSMIQAKDTKTKEELREEQTQQNHKKIEEKLKEKLGKSDVRL
ncbi:type IV secretion system protein VirB5 [Bartonella henselae]|uniref:17kDa antigen n=1 Tax=Bartonella henselae TaxID=38323 RepID=Q845X5_BARHN|nr:type IV secretion system protein [Bartonella henselae]AFK10351.1 VirB5 [Bartonella henselae]MDM9996694.1 type IV secretion system protein [Bartonella henselae]OLL47117.1 type IV secretion system protein VirB5 [Bartonella henselae]OLL51682.1 type IV secretion system protein VirB5 [Bartonella henselae]OLL51990.1 type IV secretion system protein VirB5 [Bartonella henselae]